MAVADWRLSTGGSLKLCCSDVTVNIFSPILWMILEFVLQGRARTSTCGWIKCAILGSMVGSKPDSAST